MNDVTIVICYVNGTSKMLSACLSSIKRHTSPDYSVLIVTKEGNADQGLLDAASVFDDSEVLVRRVEVPCCNIEKGREHGSLLDRVMETEVLSEYVLTMDSDTLPIADGWLEGLLELLSDEKVCSAGILHPWEPPPKNLKKNKIEWRVRTQHCWDTTHVACQLLRMRDVLALKESGIGYMSGDDTGLGMIQSMKDSGRTCAGYKLSRCPKPKTPFDSEFNRYVCVVYADKVVHVGGHTRTLIDGDDEVFGRVFGWATNKILEDGNAEFLLAESNSHLYQFDKESEVIQEKLNRLFGLFVDKMKG